MRKAKNTPVVRQSADVQKHKPIQFRNSDAIYAFKREEIVSVQACNNQVCFYTLANAPAEQKNIISMEFKEVVQILNNLPFMKVHRSWIVNLINVRALLTKGGYTIKTVTNQLIPLSKAYRDQFILAFEQFF